MYYYITRYQDACKINKKESKARKNVFVYDKFTHQVLLTTRFQNVELWQGNWDPPLICIQDASG